MAWQYKVVFGELDETQLNELGAQGWELVAIYGNVYYYFKKPI